MILCREWCRLLAVTAHIDLPWTSTCCTAQCLASKQGGWEALPHPGLNNLTHSTQGNSLSSTAEKQTRHVFQSWGGDLLLVFVTAAVNTIDKLRVCDSSCVHRYALARCCKCVQSPCQTPAASEEEWQENPSQFEQQESYKWGQSERLNMVTFLH